MRAKKFGDKGEPANNNIVDANMRVLRERMEEMKKKEMKMKMVMSRRTRGWDYKRSYENKYKREAVMSEIAETMGLACGAFGLVFLSGSLGISLVSLLSHHHI
ncbi:hypothetical protein K1719_029796 [Acacia pycnantha]|nr:hypothetical protein K1719_029796 [Acacia pycnantha]